MFQKSMTTQLILQAIEIQRTILRGPDLIVIK